MTCARWRRKLSRLKGTSIRGSAPSSDGFLFGKDESAKKGEWIECGKLTWGFKTGFTSGTSSSTSGTSIPMASACPSSETMRDMLSCMALFERSWMMAAASSEEDMTRSPTTCGRKILRSTMRESRSFGVGVLTFSTGVGESG